MIGDGEAVGGAACYWGPDFATAERIRELVNTELSGLDVDLDRRGSHPGHRQDVAAATPC
jgi:hypothetical protein